MVENEFGYTNEYFVDPTPNDGVTKEDIIIYNLELLNKNNSDYQIINEEIYKNIDSKIIDSNSKLDLLIEQGNTGNSSIGDSNSQILNKLESIRLNTDTIHLGNSTIYTYGVYYIPFAIIIFLLWRFFATFLRSAR